MSRALGPEYGAVTGFVTIGGSADRAPVTIPLPSYLALVEYSKQSDASPELVHALSAPNLLEPVKLQPGITPELLRIIAAWLSALPVAAWPAGLFELRSHLQEDLGDRP